MNKKIKMNLMLVLAFTALALVIFFVVKMTSKNNNEPSNTSAATTAAPNPTAGNSFLPTGTQEVDTTEIGIPSVETSSESLSETQDPKTITGEGGQAGTLTALDYLPSMGWFKNVGTFSTVIDSPSGSFQLTVGAETGLDKAIVINPVVDYPDKNVAVGYFAWCAYGYFDAGRDPYIAVNDLQQGTENYYINRTYDRIQNAKYESDAKYGLIWTDEEHEQPQQHIGLLIMDAKKRQLLGVAAIDVVMEDGAYVITGVRDAQCKDSETVELLTAIYKNDILNSKSLILAEGDVDNSTIIIEKLDSKSTYFKLYKKPSVSMMQSSFLLNYPIYAVTMNNESFGPITFYYSVKESIGDKPIKFEYIGQDLINIRTQDDLHK